MNDQDVKYAITAEDRFSRTFQNMRRELTDIDGRVQTFAAAAGRVFVPLLAATAGFGSVAGLRQLANDIDSLNDASDALGDTVENLSALENVARRNGASLDLVWTAVDRVNKALAEGNPDSPILRTLRALGLDAAELRRLDPSEALRRIAVAMAGVANDGERARAQTALFGKSTREVASYLNDLAAAGDLNATVTTSQAQAAEQFNKNLAALDTNVNQVARSVANYFFPAINQMFDAVRGEGVGSLDRYLAVPLQTAAVVGANVSFVLKGIGVEIGGIAAQAAAVSRGDFRGARAIGEQMREDAKRAREEFDKLERKIMQIGEVEQATYSNEGRARAEPPRRLRNLAETQKTTPQVSDAQRYLEQLERQEKTLAGLTQYEQALEAIRTNSLRGLTPALEKDILLRAKSNDLRKEQLQLMEREVGFQKLLSDKNQADLNAAMDELANTSSGRRGAIERRADLVLSYARQNPENEAIQEQALEALGRLRKEFEALDKAFDPLDASVQRVETTIDRMAERSIDAIAEFAATGKGSFDSLFDTFKADLLRELIEDPVRASMRNVVDIIGKELGKIGTENSPVTKLADYLSTLFKSSGTGSSGGGAGNFLGTIGGFFGFTSRANGGGVRAGQLVRWEEGGREWFMPGSDGQVVTERQMGSGGQPVTQQNTYNINGGSEDWRRQVAAMLDERDARLVRSLQYGRLRRV